MESTVFAGKTLLITGGTGSFGNTVLKHFLSTDIGEIRIFSRDEKKQDDMRHDYQLKYPELSGKIKFYIGDVRNPDSLRGVMRGVDYIFHAAALKQVPSCEFFPMEAVRTNVLGTDNVLTAAIDAGVKKVVCLSTDKAAYPINAMGISKAMMEKVIGAKARTVKAEATTICCTRYGNVMASRGSVIPLFKKQIAKGGPVTVTHPDMKRYFMTIPEASQLVLQAGAMAKGGEVFVLDMGEPVKICDLAKTLITLSGLTPEKDIEIKYTGLRPGEKLFEELLSAEDGTEETCHEKIFTAKLKKVSKEKMDMWVQKLLEQADEENVVGMLKKVVPTYTPNRNKG